MSTSDSFIEADGTRLCVLIRMLNNGIHRYIDRNFERKKEFKNLSCSGAWIIGRLYRAEEEGKDIFQKDLEDEFGITRSTVSKVLSGMELKGLISRGGTSHDRRLKKVLLTDKSREIALNFKNNDKLLGDCMSRGFSEEELKTLCGFLERLGHNLEERERRK